MPPPFNYPPLTNLHANHIGELSTFITHIPKPIIHNAYLKIFTQLIRTVLRVAHYYRKLTTHSQLTLHQSRHVVCKISPSSKQVRQPVIPTERLSHKHHTSTAHSTSHQVQPSTRKEYL